MPSTVVRDPIHGMVALTPGEWKAVDTSGFQRLRSIKQLAMTHLAYPGAVHTRFEHSIGVRHVADQLAGRLGVKGEERTVVNAAGLLHDVGHGVFSHVSEQVIDDLSGVEDVHEAVSAFVMRNDPDLHTALGKEVCERAADLVARDEPRSATRDIVSGPTDADKLDYLLRDSYFAGVKYGQYDIAKVVESARTIGLRSAQTQLGFEAEGVWAVEGLLLARHHMHRQVYGHKTRIATDIMITRALRLGVEEGALPERAFKVDATDDGRPLVTEGFVEAYMDQTDASLLETLAAAEDAPRARDLAQRLVDRRLLRRVADIRLDERVADLGEAAYSDILDPEVFTPSQVEDIEQRIADALELEPHLVAFHLDARSNPTYRGPSGAVSEQEILFQRDDGPPRVLAAESEIFQQAVGQEHAYAYLFTPELDDGKTQTAKELLWKELAGD